MYDFKIIEQKWQSFWENNFIFKTNNNLDGKKFFALVEFPYPSGKGLHVGHPRSYTAMDIISRKRRMQGYNVLFCIGWDAFGLPTENFAIKNKKHPMVITTENINKFRSQLKNLGISFDWSREINTTDYNYYKWTQWIFIQLFNKGLAYKNKTEVNWCENCKCILANEEINNNICKKCGNIIVKKIKDQWLLKITKYADRLINDLKNLDWPENIKKQQINWIGKSIGIKIKFHIYYNNKHIDFLEVFTTKPYTIFGVTYLAMSYNNKFLIKWEKLIKNFYTIKNNATIGNKLEGFYAINPYTKEKIEIFTANYVLDEYGTGVVMGVPGHDKRDYDFATAKFIKIKKVIDEENNIIINSEFLNNLNINEAEKFIIKDLIHNNIGTKIVNYHLKDWIFSRQRYWGEPIPMILCPKCGWLPIPEKNLPLKLPKIDYYCQTDNGESPLSLIDEWVNVKCHICNHDAKRETDTMPQWAGSSWYYIRYLDPNNEYSIADKKYINYWLPVDWYNGGMEHTTLHLLYSRFWHKFLYDLKILNCKEPYLKRSSQGIILGTNNEKMSKSKGNVINPDDIINEYGADTLRLYEMFIGDFEKVAIWSQKSIIGCQKFLNRIYMLQNKIISSNAMLKNSKILNNTIKKVSDDIEKMKFNTAISALMELTNFFYKNSINDDEYKILLILIYPFAPHISEEIWQNKKYEGYVHQMKWPTYLNHNDLDDNFVKIIIQLNGNMKKIIKQNKGLNKTQTIDNNKAIIDKIILGKNIIKIIYISDKVINFVTEK